MTTKRIICLALAILLTLCLAACGDEGNIPFPDTKGSAADTSADVGGGTDTEKAPLPTSDIEDTEDTEDDPDPTPVFSDYSIRPAAWENVVWETYTSVYFTVEIPRGWNVQWQGDANRMQWIAASPDYTVGMSNLDHDYACKDSRAQSLLGFSVSTAGGTVREYFEETYRDSAEYFTVKNSCVPDDINLIRQARPYSTIHDYEAIYAVFKDANVEGEGIYSAVVMDSKDVWFNGLNYGAWEINRILTEWAPQGDLVNWVPVIAHIVESFRYTDYYIREWQYIAQSTLTPSTELSDNDPVMEAFEERSKSDTIIQEKRSDMIGEYERVYDNDSGNIYRAYNGFLDDIGDQSRFTPITDSQYTEGYVGWIDRD